MPRAFSLRSSGIKSQDAESLAPRTTSLNDKDPIGVGRLLEVYDDYPKVVRSLEYQMDRADQATEEARLATERAEEQALLATERAEELASLKEELNKVQEAKAKTDKKVKDDLEPEIKELKTKLKSVTEQRDKTQKELDAKRKQLGGWITKVEAMRKNRKEIEEHEQKAAELRTNLASKAEELDDELLEGLRLAEKPALDESKSGTGKSAGSEPTTARSKGVATPDGGASITGKSVVESTKKEGSKEKAREKISEKVSKA